MVFGGIKNWVILGAVAVGGYFLWQQSKKWFPSSTGGESGGAASSTPPGQPSASPPALPSGIPDLNGPVVKKGVLASSKNWNCTSAKAAGMQYAKVTSTDAQGYSVFKPTVNGRFTRRMLCQGNNKWAEIRPS